MTVTGESLLKFGGGQHEITQKNLGVASTKLWITPTYRSNRSGPVTSYKASCTPSSVIPVGHSSEATRLNSAKLWRTPTPHPSDPRPATYTVTLSTLWRVLPYR